MKRCSIVACVFVSLLAALWFAGPAAGQNAGGGAGSVPLVGPKPESGDAAAGKDASQTADSPFPGVGEVVPNETALAMEAAEAKDHIAEGWDATSIAARMEDCEARHGKIKELIAKMGESDSWDLNRLKDAMLMVGEEKKRVQAIISLISTRLSEIESWKKEWEKKQNYWRDWKKSLETTQSEVPAEVFLKARESIRGVLETISNATKQSIKEQEKLSKLLDENGKLSTPLEAAMTKLRGELFKRNDHSFFSKDFYAQFDSRLWPRTLERLHGAIDAQKEIISNGFGMVLCKIAIITVICLAVLAYRRGRAGEGREEMLLAHPLALSIFVVEILSMFTSQQSTGLGRYIEFLILAFSSLMLMPAIRMDGRARAALFFLTIVVACRAFVQMASLPSPLYRPVLALLSILGIIFFWIQARISRRISAGKLDLYAVGFAAGAFAMVCALISQAAGYVSLSNYFSISFSAVFFLGVWLLLFVKIGSLAIDSVLNLPIVTRRPFMREFGADLDGGVRKVFMFATFALWALQLIKVLGSYASTWQAAEKVLNLHVRLGSVVLSVGTVFSVVLVFYVSKSLSWWLRGVLKIEVYPRKNVDSGAGEAVNKLVHYGLVLVGFLFALGMIGIEPNSLVVLGGSLGIGLGFGLQSITNNFISGLILLFEQPIREGDMIIVDKEQGRVRKIGLRATIIKSGGGSEHIVPNSQLISQSVINLTLSDSEARLKIPVAVAHGNDIGLVLSVLKDVARENPRVLDTPAPLAYLLGLGDSSLNFELHAWLSHVGDRLLAQSEINQQIARKFQELGIEISPPQPIPSAVVLREDSTRTLMAAAEPAVSIAKK